MNKSEYQPAYNFLRDLVAFHGGSMGFIRDGDETKRRELRGLGYRIVVIKTDDMVAGLKDLKSKI